jgi:hypothetical protein
MLGNGFSVDLFHGIFNYKALADRVTSTRIKRLFAEIGTNDFENIMRRLTDALRIVSIYPEGTATGAALTADLNELRSTRIEVINQSHPANPLTISDTRYDYCQSFLKHFDGGKKYIPSSFLKVARNTKYRAFRIAAIWGGHSQA